MNSEEMYCRLRDNEPTFLQYCCSLMVSGKIEKMIINEYTNKYEKIVDAETSELKNE